jgi:hypothetical protein
VRGCRRTNRACGEKGESLEEVDGDRDDGDGGAGGAAPALAQQEVPVAMVDCIIGGICIGTSGHDTITGSDQYDEMYGLEGDDLIDSGNDSEQDYVSCGPGFDTVNQELVPGAPLDVIESDCEVVAL